MILCHYVLLSMWLRDAHPLPRSHNTHDPRANIQGEGGGGRRKEGTDVESLPPFISGGSATRLPTCRVGHDSIASQAFHQGLTDCDGRN